MQSGKAQVHEIRVHAAEDLQQIQLVNKPSWISLHEISNSIICPRIIKIKGRGGGLKKRAWLINFLPLKREGLLEGGGGGHLKDYLR